MEIAWAAVDELLDEFGDVGAGGPFCRQATNLLFGGNLACQKKPEKTFREGLVPAGGFGQKLLAFGDLGNASTCAMPEPDSLYLTVLPRKRMPSSESRTDPSHTSDLMPRAPP